MTRKTSPLLPGILPALPPNAVERGKLLLSLTSELIDVRGRALQLEREITRITESFHEGAA